VQDYTLVIHSWQVFKDSSPSHFEQTRKQKFPRLREITLLEYTFGKFLKGSGHFEQTRNLKFPRLREITLLEYTFGKFLKGSSHFEQTRNQKFPH
jgi:hypothetical protein